jgi:hypothetical protein
VDLSSYQEAHYKPDVTATGPLYSKLLQNTSDLSRYDRAKAGDFVLALPGMQDVVIPRGVGVTMVMCAGVELWVEWAPGFGGQPPLERFYVKPLDAERVENGFGWRRRSTGNKLEQTVEMFALANVNGDWHPVVFAWKSTALKVAQKAMSDATRLRTTIGSDEAAVMGGRWLLTSIPEKNEFGTWFLPSFELKALVGQPGGPSPAILQKACDARREIRISEEGAREEQKKLFAGQSKLQIEHDDPVSAGRRGGMRVETGLASLASRRPDLAPAASGKDPNDDIPW